MKLRDKEWFQEENQHKFVWRYGVIRGGIPVGFVASVFIVLENQIGLGATWEKILFILGGTLIVGPFGGWILGHLIWGKIRAQLQTERVAAAQRESLEKRLNDLESAVRENSQIPREIRSRKKGDRPIDSDS